MTNHKWTIKQYQFLEEIVPGRSYREIAEIMNKQFNLNLSIHQIKGAIGRKKLNTGRTGHFPKGNVPFNKGMRGINFGGENGKRTQFKKGQIPINYRPVGSERVNVDGYVEVKVTDPNKWQVKHRVIWEQANGPIPKGHTVIFGDGNRQNFELDNLILITRRQLLMLNKFHLIKNDADLTKVGVAIADLQIKIQERVKGDK